jgi:hypothetical protein
MWRLGPHVAAKLRATRRRRHIILPDTYERICGAPHIRSVVICSFSGESAANARHSAYSLRFARIAYRWHPLFGRTLQVSPFRRGKDLRCIYTEERPDLCRELPNWMFDEAYCGGMTLGRPEVNLASLHELDKVLAACRS